ncbi:MAG TPA: hypothetical protein VMP00_01620 [Burkholderiales bacterium]|nr:hypothetical protein [Burkholderiales bacterium]
MIRKTMTAAIAAAFIAPVGAIAQDTQSTSAAYSARPLSAESAFNPAISLILDGKYRHFKQDPDDYTIGGFLPPGGGHDDDDGDGHAHGFGPGEKGFGLDASELTISANIDPYFTGYFTAGISGEDEIEIEEAFIQNSGYLPGATIKFGRFLSGFGYLNERHAHTWDFVDAPLVHQAFFGGHLQEEGLQLRYVAPTPIFLQFGLEGGRGAGYPGSEREKNGFNSGAAFVHVGGDVGFSNSYRFGASYRQTRAAERHYEGEDLGFEADPEAEVELLDVESKMWGVDFIWKWAPNGDPYARNFKFQAEYFQSEEDGDLEIIGVGGPDDEGAFNSKKKGWYAQAVYQFMPRWRAGVRYDELRSGSFNFVGDDGIYTAADLEQLRRHKPKRTSAMIDFSPSEFSRFRVQFSRDEARFDEKDNQIFVQYIMSLGAHGAHRF